MFKKYFDEKNQGQKARRKSARPESYHAHTGSIFFPGASMHPIEPSYQIGIWVSMSSGTFSKLAKITTQNSIFSNFEANFLKFSYLCGKNNNVFLAMHSMLGNNST